MDLGWSLLMVLGWALLMGLVWGLLMGPADVGHTSPAFSPKLTKFPKHVHNNGRTARLVF
jgi:hypothetical protein